MTVLLHHPARSTLDVKDSFNALQRDYIMGGITL